MLLAVNTGNFPGSNHEIFGAFFLASVLPGTLKISTLSGALFLGGPGTVDYSINIVFGIVVRHASSCRAATLCHGPRPRFAWLAQEAEGCGCVTAA